MHNKKVLILGNGFDLAHGLPTGYLDFLHFCKNVFQLYDYGVEKNKFMEIYKGWNVDFEIKNRLLEAYNNRIINLVDSEVIPRKEVAVIDLDIEHIHEYLNNNVWYNYISQITELMNGNKWIDFETEISTIIQFIDKAHISLQQDFRDLSQRPEVVFKDNINSLRDDKNYKERISLFFKEFIYCSSWEGTEQHTVKDLRDRLFDDLEKLILSLEIYLVKFVEKIQIPEEKKISSILDLKPDCILSFNYTRTYENYYSKDVPVCHIHGTCKEDSNIDTYDLVLGIDEYLPKDKQYNNVDFSAFKKFIQRLRNKNDIRYAHWIRDINEDYSDLADTWSGVPVEKINETFPDRVAEVWIFGHSLDATDKDVLKLYFDSEATAIHIFARNKESEGELIEKLLKYIDESILIKKSVMQPSRFEFIRLDKKP